MPEYTLYFTTTASQSVTVEAGDLDEAIDEAYEEIRPSLCASCSGFDRLAPGIDLGDWEIDEKSAQEDYPA